MQKLLILAVTFYGALCLLVFLYQKNLLFFPDRTPLAECPGLKLLGATSYESPDGSARLYHIPTNDPSPKGWILHFHGNGGRACDRLDTAEGFRNLGYHVILGEYPGYAEDKPLPSIKEILASAEKSFSYIAEKNIENLPVILYGESLGTGPITYLAGLNLKNVSALILQTPFTSLGDVGQHHYFYLPVKLLIKEDFQTSTWAKNVKVPVLIFHGTDDEVIPFKFGKLQAQNFAPERTTFLEFKGSHHNDLFYLNHKEIWNGIKDFLDREL